MKFDQQKWDVGHLLKNSSALAVPSFQREPDIWDLRKKKLFIDSIFRDWKIPKIYLNNSKKASYEIIDGQQRIATILEFVNNRFKVPVNSTEEEFDFASLEQKYQEAILNFKIDIELITEASEEDAALLFSRLQEGEVLNDWEKLNAITGKLADFVKSIEEHVFFTKTGISGKRFGIKGICQQLAYLQARGTMSLEYHNLREFFEGNSDFDDERVKQRIRNTLDFMNLIFPQQESYLASSGNVLSIFILCAWLLEKKVELHHMRLRKFFTNFFNNVGKTDTDRDFVTYNIMLLQSTSAAGPLKSRDEILRRHMCLSEPEVMRYLSSAEMPEFRRGIEESLKETTKSIHELVKEINERAIGKGRHTVFDLTAESSQVFSSLSHSIRDPQEYVELVDLLWKAFYEGSKSGSTIGNLNDDRNHVKPLHDINILIKIDDLRKVQFHDLEHDRETYEEKLKRACDIRDLFTGKKLVQDFDENDFIVFQYRIANEILQFMKSFNESLK